MFSGMMFALYPWYPGMKDNQIQHRCVIQEREMRIKCVTTDLLNTHRQVKLDSIYRSLEGP